MKRLFALATVTLLTLTGCAGASQAPDETVIRVAVVAPPMTDVVRAAADEIEAGFRVELIEVSDYVQPNVMLQAGEIDANFIQFEGFMQEFNEANGADLVVVQPVYHTIVSFYSREFSSLAELPEGAHVVIPQDRSNGARALQLLASEGLVELDPAVELFAARTGDIVSNPRNLRITEVDLLQLNAAYAEADAVMNLPSFARQIGLTPQRDGIASEQDPRFAVSLVTRNDNHDRQEIQALTRAMTSESVRVILEESGNPPAF